MKRYEVAVAWVDGKKAAAGLSYDGKIRFSTDGLNLWSYGMLIGITSTIGVKTLLNVKSDNVSTGKTTSAHFNDASSALRKAGKPVNTVEPVKNGGYESGFQVKRWNDWLEFPQVFLDAKA